MVAIWALRLSVYITLRNHGKVEDHRYQAIRRKNEPHFWFKSLYIVFLLQGLLAWVICLPALAAVSGQTAPGPLDFLGLALWLIGMYFEVVGDWQLARFRRGQSSSDDVLDSGLWRYTRHPNYFGEAMMWWGIFLFALSVERGWTAVISPLLITFLLLRVSGIAMLEKKYRNNQEFREYARKTSPFFPWFPKD